MSLNALYSFLSHVYFYFGENANLRVCVEILIKHDNVMDLMIKITGRNILIKDNVSVSS